MATGSNGNGSRRRCTDVNTTRQETAQSVHRSLISRAPFIMAKSTALVTPTVSAPSKHKFTTRLAGGHPRRCFDPYFPALVRSSVPFDLVVPVAILGSLMRGPEQAACVHSRFLQSQAAACCQSSKSVNGGDSSPTRRRGFTKHVLCFSRSETSVVPLAALRRITHH